MNSFREQHSARFQGLTDEQLMQQFQGGSDAAFSELMKRYEKRLFMYLFRYTRHEQDTEDIVQETFMRVYSSRNSYEEIARFSTWLYTIAGNLMRTRFKRQQRRQTVSIDQEHNHPETVFVVQLPDDNPLPDEQVYHALTAKAVQEAISRLPKEYRELLEMREMQQLTYEEIAQAVNLPLGTVKSRLNRGRLRLQKILTAYFGTEAVFAAA
ncbi:RNA polymerase sigma-70 factor, ECF subfamily [Cyclonatronum proteinivorum]|uniref:RNA polymerase sigma factor n=1 Tax=Cyclonatronum proteinivorum TaxID=1457365 RepID=A0A345UKE7_9BACT|nr:sigma-70 family RNA polymerase sigma factor [Cyclonatronum proteinivorum]AXJ00949.1 RNA polymerase sigma-70 factor, ECF subfamily [Cyclonatronum proteinivorum]